MKPIRVQRKRVKGWRMPENTVSVCRPGKWGNPFGIEKFGDQAIPLFEMFFTKSSISDFPANAQEKAISSKFFKHFRHKTDYMNTSEMVISELKGKNLACFCSLDKPCHADILLKIANA